MHPEQHQTSTRQRSQPNFGGSSRLSSTTKFHDTDDLKTQLAASMPALVKQLVPGAKRFGADWRCGDLDGSKGQSLWIGATGQWKDHATDDGGGPIDLIMAVHGLDFLAAKDWAAAWLGLSDTVTPADQAAIEKRRQEAQQAQARADAETAQDRQRRFELAKDIWISADQVTADNLAGRYLAGRGIAFDRLGPEPLAVMRFIEHCPIGSSERGRTAPALVFKVKDATKGATAGIQRVFLNADATRDKSLGKRRLGSTNTPCIQFHSDLSGGMLAVGEGPETCLALWANADIRPIWSCVDAGGLSRFPLIDGVQNLHIFADAGDTGRNAAVQLGQRYADGGCWSRAKVAKFDDYLSDISAGEA